MPSPYESVSPSHFLDFEKGKVYGSAIEYLPPYIDQPQGTTFDYPRTILNGLLQRKKLSLLEAMLIEDDIMELYSDHYDTDALEHGNFLGQAVMDIKQRIKKRHIDVSFKPQHITSRHGNHVEQEIIQSLKRRRSVVLGDSRYAVLVTGVQRGNLLSIVTPFPKIDVAEGQTQVLSLPKVVKAVARKDGYAWSIS